MEKFVHNAFDKKYGFDKINDRQALQERFDNIPKAKSIKPLNESMTKKEINEPKTTKYFISVPVGAAGTTAWKNHPKSTPNSILHLNKNENLHNGKRIKESILHEDEELLTEAPANLMATPGTVANFLAQNIDTIWGITDPVELKQAVMDMIENTDEITQTNKDKTIYVLTHTPTNAILSTIATMITGCKV